MRPALRQYNQVLPTTPITPPEGAPSDSHALSASESRRALAGFFLFGILSSALGAFLPAWGYHLEPDLRIAGNYFLCLNAGLLLALRAAIWLLPRGIVFCLVLASSLACGAFILLALMPAPPSPILLSLGLLLLGLGAGLLNASIFHAISPLYEHDRAATTTLAGTLYGLGCVLTALLVAGTYYAYSLQKILFLFAAIPGLFIAIFAYAKFPREMALRAVPLRDVLRDFRNPGAILFALILFFQFGSEWSIAGWLPIFLIRRLGISPETSLFLLALYWTALMVGRVTAKALLKGINHGKLLLGSTLFAILGCILLSYTTNQGGATAGILCVGGGFASIYPLVVEKIGHRFTYYHPGVYNGIFSFAFTGGLLAPFLLGYLAHWWGIGAVMVMPMLGAFMVFLLVLCVMLESRLTGESKRARA